MKKLALAILAATLIMTPFSAFAMDVITDSELEAVIGQSGVTIAYYDILLDLDITNIAWGDTDCGTLILSTLSHAYSPGYININNIKVDNFYMDLDSDTMGTATDIAGGSYIAWGAHPITIDVMTFSSNGPHCPAQALRGKTPVVIGLSDYYAAIESVSIDGIYLDDHPYTIKVAEFTSVQKWNYTTIGYRDGDDDDDNGDDDDDDDDDNGGNNDQGEDNGPTDDSKNLGTLLISGIQFTQHAYVGGYESINTVPGGKLMPINPNHRAVIFISAH